MAPSTHDIVSLVNLREELGDIAWIAFQVSVQTHDRTTLRLLDSG